MVKTTILFRIQHRTKQLATVEYNGQYPLSPVPRSLQCYIFREAKKDGRGFPLYYSVGFPYVVSAPIV
jgi:hypothetical protein